MINKSVSTFQSPMGPIRIEVQGEFVTGVRFVEQGSHNSNEEDSSFIRSCITQLEEYFTKNRDNFTIPTKLHGTDFEQQVWNELRKIPYGQTISYEQLAVQLGDVKKIRAAAHTNGKNPIAIIVPCHRVIGKDGGLVGYAGGLDRKKWLLTHEGAIGKQISIF